MGTAIIIPNLDFSENNLGQVTFNEDVAITGLSISAGTASDNTIQMEVTYVPTTTTERGVTWSISSGSDYATIDADSGLLTILSGASESEVVVLATSTYDSSITASCTLSVTYERVITLIYYIATNGTNYVDTGIVPELGFSSQITYNARECWTGNTFLMGEVGYKTSASSYAGSYTCAMLANNGTSGTSYYICRSHGGTSNLLANTNTADIFTVKVGDSEITVTKDGEVVTTVSMSITSDSYLYKTTHTNYYLFNCNVRAVGSSSDTTSTGPQENTNLFNVYDFVIYQDDTEVLHLYPALVDGVPMFVDDDNNEYPINGSNDIIYMESEGGTEVTYTPE